jgi:hypothetical protein
MYSLFYSLILSFKTVQYSYRFLALNIMAQTCSPCSLPLCGKPVTKTRTVLKAEVMVVVVVVVVIIIIIIINITVIPRYVQAKKKLNTMEGRGFESAFFRFLVKHDTTELPQCAEFVAPICFE